jgi:hypothetical protein
MASTAFLLIDDFPSLRKALWQQDDEVSSCEDCVLAKVMLIFYPFYPLAILVATKGAGCFVFKTVSSGC